MRLSNGENTELELRAVGYQFPELATGMDSNWLMIELLARHPRGSWRRTDPALLTWELVDLATWLEQVALNRGDHEVWFIEPCLSLSATRNEEAGSTHVRIHVSHEFAPPWAEADEGADLNFELTEAELGAAAASLREQVKRFPQRASRGA